MRILLTGATGLIGSRFEELLYETHDLVPLSSSHGVDITDISSIESFLKDKKFDAIVHLAGKTNVDECEEDKQEDLELLGVEERNLYSFNASEVAVEKFKGKKTALAANFIGTKNIYDFAKKSGTKFVYISSDFVFSGRDEFYTEESKPEPVDWYGMSKYLGERVINTGRDLIVRISFPYGYKSAVKKDLVWKLHDLLDQKEEVSLISDQIITPSFIDDIVFGINYLLGKEVCGIYHLSGSSYLSPFEIGEKLKMKFNLNTVIRKSQLEEVYKGKAPRPFQSRIKNDKLGDLGFKPKTFDEGLALISIA